MSRLLLVELHRLFARRVSRFVALALFLGIVAAGIGMAVNSSRDLAGARAAAAGERAKFVQSQARAYKDCVLHVPADQANQCPPTDGADAPPESAFFHDPRFSFADHVQDLLHTGVIVGGLAVLLLASSFVGAEWQAGTFATLLMWEPRRPRVAATKVAAVVIGSLALVTVATALLVGVAALVAETRGTLHSLLPPATTPQQSTERAHLAFRTWAMAGRGECVVALLAVGGAALALLLRSTVAALGVAIGYLIVGEGIIGSLRHGDVRHHLLQSRLAALFDGTYSWFVPVGGSDGSVEFGSGHVKVVHALPAGLELLAVAAVLLAGATLALQRRDVT
jgi:ABC-2 type transport system permease protein